MGLTNRVNGDAQGGTVTVVGQSVPLLDGSAGPGPVTALVRPESVRLQPDPTGDAHVVAVSFLGSLCRAQVGLADGELDRRPAVRRRGAGLAVGAPVRVSVLPVPIFAVPRDQPA